MGKQYSFLLSIVLGLFLALFILLCYYNRLATDDYYFIWDVRNHGIITGVVSQYLEWCGRIAATFAMDVFYKLFDVNYQPYALLSVFSLLSLFAGFYLDLGLLSKRLSFELPRKERSVLAGCLTALLFFLSVDTGESWFWFCSYSTYLWSIIALVWGIYFLFSPGKNTFSYAGIFLCFLYIGSASELYTAIYGLIMAIILLRQWKSGINRRILFSFIVMGTAFVIFLLAPGNYLRDGLFPAHSFLYSFFITAKSFAKFGFLYVPFRLHYILVFALPFLVVGYNAPKLALPHSFTAFFLRSTLLLGAVLFVFFYLTAFVMVETGPPRVWLLVSFLLTLYSAAICFYAGNTLSMSTLPVKLSMYVSTLGGIILMVLLILRQQPIAARYSEAVDNRILYIKELNQQLGKDTLITLEPLPPCGMLYSAEIAADTLHFTNRELRLGFDLKYHVVVKR